MTGSWPLNGGGRLAPREGNGKGWDWGWGQQETSRENWIRTRENSKEPAPDNIRDQGQNGGLWPRQGLGPRSWGQRVKLWKDFGAQTSRAALSSIKTVQGTRPPGPVTSWALKCPLLLSLVHQRKGKR